MSHYGQHPVCAACDAAAQSEATRSARAAAANALPQNQPHPFRAASAPHQCYCGRLAAHAPHTSRRRA